MGFKLPTLPDSITNPAVRDLLEKYYERSNSSSEHEEFANLFTANGEYAMNGKASKGRDKILAFRKAIFSHIPNREHYPTHIYTHGNDVMNLMAFGNVKYGHHLGHETETEWASRYELAEEDGQLKIAKAHIVVDTAAHV